MEGKTQAEKTSSEKGEPQDKSKQKQATKKGKEQNQTEHKGKKQPEQKHTREKKQTSKKRGGANKPKKQREEGGQVVERLVAIHNFRLRFAVRSTKVWYPAVCACVFHLIVLSACINGGSHLVG